MVLLYFSSFLAMFMHIFGKSDQNMVVIVSNERQTTEQYGLLVTSSHGSELHVSGLSREPPVADEATLKAEIPTIYNWLYDQCANTAAGCEHQTQRTQKQHIRVRIRIHLHKLPCRSIASIGVRTLNVSRHRSSQLAFLSACHCNVLHPPWVKEGKRRGNNKSWVFPIEPDNGHRPYFHGLQCLV